MDYKGLTGIRRLTVAFNADTGDWPLPQDTTLEGKRLLGIRIMDNTAGDRINADGKSAITNAVMRQGHMTLQRNSNNFIDTIPLDFFVTQTHDQFTKVDIDGFDPTQSSLNFKGTIASNALNGKSLTIIFLYENPGVAC